ncbi:MAG: 30S ribosomal protein S19e [Thermoplasmata archaeon]
MVTCYDVPPDKLIRAMAAKLKENEAFTPPEWADKVKTGVHKELPPMEKDWWHVRVAAILRKVYVLGPIGESRLSAKFGGVRDRRNAPNRARKGSGSITRKGLQQLEKAGFVETKKAKGRVVTSKGRSFVDNTAHEVFKELVKTNTELGKY